MADAPDPKQNPLPLDPRLQAYLADIMNLSVQRQEDQYPLHQAAMAMATRMAPGYAQNAMTAPPKRTDPSNTKLLTGGPIGDGPSGGSAATAAFVSTLLSALAGGSGGSGNISKLIQDLINLFRHGGRDTVQGDKPFPGGALNASPQSIMDFKRFGGWPEPTSGHNPTPGVSTSEDFRYPWPDTNDDILRNANFLNPGFRGPSDPSSGTGVGPGMDWYYNHRDAP